MELALVLVSAGLALVGSLGGVWLGGRLQSKEREKERKERREELERARRERREDAGTERALGELKEAMSAAGRFVRAEEMVARGTGSSQAIESFLGAPLPEIRRDMLFASDQTIHVPIKFRNLLHDMVMLSTQAHVSRTEGLAQEDYFHQLRRYYKRVELAGIRISQRAASGASPDELEDAVQAAVDQCNEEEAQRAAEADAKDGGA